MNDIWCSKAKTLEQSLESTKYSFNELKATISEGQFMNATEIDKMNEAEKLRIGLSDKVTCLQQELVERDMNVKDMEKPI